MKRRKVRSFRERIPRLRILIRIVDVCRAIVSEAALLIDAMTGNLVWRRRASRKLGYLPNIRRPRTFNEKLMWKAENDRSPLLTRTSDKLAVRGYVAEVLGEDRASEILIPVLHATDDPSTLPFDDLPSDYVIKATHASGRNIFVTPGKPVDREQIIWTCRRWLREPFGRKHHQWYYQGITRRILVEPIVRTADGRLPDDYKLHMFHGRCVFIGATRDRFGSLTRNLYTPDWESLHVVHDTQRRGDPEPRPGTLDEMISLAEALSAPFDYVRVDFYRMDSTALFSELTHCPGGGDTPLEPRRFAFLFGERWRLRSDDDHDPPRKAGGIAPVQAQ